MPFGDGVGAEAHVMIMHLFFKLGITKSKDCFRRAIVGNMICHQVFFWNGLLWLCANDSI